MALDYKFCIILITQNKNSETGKENNLLIINIINHETIARLEPSPRLFTLGGSSR